MKKKHYQNEKSELTAVIAVCSVQSKSRESHLTLVRCIWAKSRLIFLVIIARLAMQQQSVLREPLVP